MAYDFNPFKKQLTAADEWLKKEFQQIEGARSIRVQPWDKAQIKEIEKAITLANLGVATVVDGDGVRINFPELTGERRTEIAKIAKDKLEEAKKELRRYRDVVVKDLQAKEKSGGYGKDEIFRLTKETQKLIDDANKKLEDALARKEKEIIS